MILDQTDAAMAMRRRVRYEAQLRQEYDYLKLFKVVLQSADGARNTSYTLEELFDMYDVTKDKREPIT